MQRLASRRDRGSALVIAVIMIVVMSAMIGALLASPNAQLAQIADATAKERSVQNADAGVREAVVWLMANRTNLPTYIVQNSSIMVSTTGGVVPSGSTWPTTVIPSGQTQKTGLSPDPTNTSTTTNPSGPSLILTYSTSFFRSNGTPIFANGNFKSFGNPRAFDGTSGASTPLNAYAYCIQSVGNDYYKIMAEGRALSGVRVTTTSGTNQKTISSFIEVYMIDPFITSPNPGAVTFLNPNKGKIYNEDKGKGTNSTNGWKNPAPTTFTSLSNPIANPVIYTSTSGGGSDKISNSPSGTITGTDTTTTGTPTNTTGVLIDTTGTNSFAFPTDGNVATGSPSITSTNNTTTLSSLEQTVNQIASLPAGSTGYHNVTYSGSPISIGDVVPEITYIKIPDGYTVTDRIFTLNGTSGQYSGVVILDVGKGVTFAYSNQNTVASNGAANQTGNGMAPIFDFNGNTSFDQGAFVWYQRGDIYIPQNGLYLMDNKTGVSGAQGNFAWNSYAYQTAIKAITPTLQFSSYRIVQ